jgi:hypothetical protein
MKEYNFFYDSSHGWLEVEFSELIELGIHQEISRGSYVSGSKVYLEEDSDACTFFVAIQEQKDVAAEIDIKFKMRDVNDPEEIKNPRQMRSYDPNVEHQCSICDGPIDVQSNGWAHGHNAQPLADGQCCSSCNMIVIQQRLEDVRSAVNDR